MSTSIFQVANQDLKAYVATTTPMFDDADAVAREAFQVSAAICSLGMNQAANLAAFATYLGWTVEQVSALASKGVVFRNSPRPRCVPAAAGLDKQVEAYALFMVQVTRLACLQFASGDIGSARAASAIAATVTRAAPSATRSWNPQAGRGARAAPSVAYRRCPGSW